MKKIITTLAGLFIILYGFSQNVGIGTNNPLEKLHIKGKLKIDTIPIGSSATHVLATNTNGVVTKIHRDSLVSTPASTDSGEIILPLVYGETITTGDIVSIGDGKTGYLSVYPSSLPPTVVSEITTTTRWVAQKFRTTSSVVGIKSVLTDLRLPGNQLMVYKAYIYTDNGGIPGTVLGATVFVHQNTTSSSFTSPTILVFNPPVPVSPVTDYHMVVTSYDSINGSGSVETFSTDVIPNGNLSITANSGATWTSYPSRDFSVRIYETQTIESRVYKSQNFDPNTVIPPGVVSTFNYNPFSNFTDKGNACIGVAKESGVAGELKMVSLGPVATIPGANLSIGTYYTVSGTAGQLGSGGTRVGMGIGPTKLLITH